MKRFGKYLLERQLAIGGMAEVFLARQHGPAGFEKTLVIKRILPHFANDEQFISMFLDEARTSAKLNHPNLVQIYELGEIEGSYYIAMEYIRGESLSKVIRRLRQHEVHMPLHLAAKVIASVCAGLDYAHNFRGSDGESLNLVHRDISPDNVLVSYDGAVKMIDFGIAKARENETKTQAGSVKGKFCYMSPEQVTGKRLDRRSDIFSLGIVLHELTTLTKPFGDGADLLTVSAIVNDEPRSAADLVEGYPKPLQGIIEKSLSKDRDKRFQNAHEMQIALERFIHSRGEFLSDRDIGAYLRKLFSDKDSDIVELREMASGIKSRVFVPTTGDIEQTIVEEGIAEAQAGASTVVADAPSQSPAVKPGPSPIAPTLAIEQPSDEEVEAHTRPATDPPPPRRSGGLLKWVILAVVLVALSVGGWFLLAHLGSDDPPPAKAANAQANGTDAATDGTDPTGTDTAGTDSAGTDTAGTDITDTDPTDTVPTDGTDEPGGTDPGGTDGTGAAVIVDAPDAGSTEPPDAGPTEPEDAGPAEPEDTGEATPDPGPALLVPVEDAGTFESTDPPVEDAGEAPVEDAGDEAAEEDAGEAPPEEDTEDVGEAPVEDTGPETPGAMGTLTVNSPVPVWVRVDGTVLGKTPVTKELPVGTRKVFVKGPGVSRTYWVALKAGQERVLEVDAPKPEPKKGTIILNIPQNMTVTIDGRAVPRGRRSVKVPYGSHRVVITDPTNPSRRASKSVDVNAARPTVTIAF